jgi:hypothetical protein
LPSFAPDAAVATTGFVNNKDVPKLGEEFCLLNFIYIRITIILSNLMALADEFSPHDHLFFATNTYTSYTPNGQCNLRSMTPAFPFVHTFTSANMNTAAVGFSMGTLALCGGGGMDGGPWNSYCLYVDWNFNPWTWKQTTTSFGTAFRRTPHAVLRGKV